MRISELIIDVLKTLKCNNFLICLLFVGWNEFDNIIEAEIVCIWRILKNLIVLFIMQTNENFLVELLRQLENFLYETSSFVVEHVIPLLLLFFFQFGHGYSIDASVLFLHFQVFYR